MPRINSLSPTPPAGSKPARVLRAIHPNAGVEAWYYAELHREISEMDADVSRAVLKAYEQAAPTGMAGDATRAPSVFIQRALAKWGEIWEARFEALSGKLSRMFADRAFSATDVAMTRALKAAGFTVKFAPTTRSVEAYRSVIAENINLIRSIPQQYLKDVQSRVWSSAMKGGDLHKLSVDLKANYGVTQKRAAFIARDQSAKAKAVVEAAHRQELGITHAIWQHSSAGKEPRPTHVAQDGKRFELRTGWFDPDANGRGKGEYVWPGTLINCRCTSRAVLPFD